MAGCILERFVSLRLAPSASVQMQSAFGRYGSLLLQLVSGYGVGWFYTPRLFWWLESTSCAVPPLPVSRTVGILVQHTVVSQDIH